MRDNNINLTGGVYFKPLHRQPIIGIRNDKNFPNTSFFATTIFVPLVTPSFL